MKKKAKVFKKGADKLYKNTNKGDYMKKKNLKRVTEELYAAEAIAINLGCALREAIVVIKLQNQGNCLEQSLEAIEAYETWLNSQRD